MKKVLLGMFILSAMAMAKENTNVYLKAGLDLYGKFKEIKEEDINVTKSEHEDLGYEFSIEATQNILPNFELGVGVGFQDHGNPKPGDNVGGKFARLSNFKSIPLYVTAKYDFPLDSEWKPYFKTDLGYSFNLKSKKTLYSNSNEDFSLKSEYNNGMYWGAGFGIEYNNIVADLMYKMNYGKVKLTENSDGETRSKSSKIDYGRVTLSVGYKFNF